MKPNTNAISTSLMHSQQTTMVGTFVSPAERIVKRFLFVDQVMVEGNNSKAKAGIITAANGLSVTSSCLNPIDWMSLRINDTVGMFKQFLIQVISDNAKKVTIPGDLRVSLVRVRNAQRQKQLRDAVLCWYIKHSAFSVAIGGTRARPSQSVLVKLMCRDKSGIKYRSGAYFCCAVAAIFHAVACLCVFNIGSIIIQMITKVKTYHKNVASYRDILS